MARSIAHGERGSAVAPMPVATGPKVLRIGVMQGTRITEERIVRDRSAVTVGATERNTFTIATGDLPPSFELFSIEEGFKKNQTSSYADNTVVGGSRQVLFNNVRKYSVAVVFFPFRTVAQPYFGFGAGILHTVKEYPQGFFGSPAASDTATALADRLGGHGFASFTGGVQFRVNRFIAFGQYQLASAPSGGKLLTGASHAFTAGLRIGLGASREETTGGGY